MVPLFLSDADFALIPMLGAYHSHAWNVSLPCWEWHARPIRSNASSATSIQKNGVIGCRSVFHGSCLLYKT